MYGGMTRNELRALTALIVLIALGVGAQTYRSRCQSGGIWVEAPPRAAAPEQAAGGEERVSLHASAPRPRPGAPPAPPAARGPLDLNRATQAELESLPMIGRERAEAIIGYRERQGAFQSADEVRLLLRFSPSSWSRIAPMVCVPGARRVIESSSTLSSAGLARSSVGIPDASTSSAAAGSRVSVQGASPLASSSVALGAGPASPPTPSIPNLAAGARAGAPDSEARGAPTPCVDINTATAAELESLWNVGPVLARRIVEYRARYGPFRAPEELMRVKGIGPATLRRNLARIRVAPWTGNNP